MQGSAQVHHAAVTTVQHNVTILTVHTVRFHHAAHIQHRVHQHIPAMGRQPDLSIPGTDQTAVLHESIHHITTDLYGCQTAIVQLQRDAFRCSQHGLPARRADGAAVPDLISRQDNISAGIRGQRTLADNFSSLFCTATEGVTTVHEVVIADVAGRGNKSRRTDNGILTKQHPVRVNQEDLTIRFQVPHDLRLAAAHHPVQRHCTAVRLVKLNRVPLADIKTVPTGHHILAVLVNVHLTAGGRLNAA